MITESCKRLRLYGADVLAPCVLAQRLFGAETFWPLVSLAPVVLAPSLLGAGRFAAAAWYCRDDWYRRRVQSRGSFIGGEHQEFQLVKSRAM